MTRMRLYLWFFLVDLDVMMRRIAIICLEVWRLFKNPACNFMQSEV